MIISIVWEEKLVFILLGLVAGAQKLTKSKLTGEKTYKFYDINVLIFTCLEGSLKRNKDPKR